MRWVLLFFIAVPLLEMLLLFRVAAYIGGLTTVCLVVLTAVIGVQILKRQGFSTLTRANQRMSAGELPGQEIVEGLLLACAGALLLTPGFITDTLGFICLTGPLRRAIARRIIDSGVLVTLHGRSAGGFYYTSRRQGNSGPESTTIEGEFTEVNAPRRPVESRDRLDNDRD